MHTIESITSATNPLLKEVRKAVARGPLTEDGLCIAESFHLIDEAMKSPAEIRVLIGSESAWGALEERLPRLKKCRVVRVPDALFQSIASTENANGAMGLVRPREWKVETLFAGTPLVVVLDGVQDPGNLGAIARAAEAFGATGLICVKGTVSPFNAKALRGSAGSLFRLPCVTGMEAGAVVELLGARGVKMFAGVKFAGDARAAQDVDFAGAAALVVGSEGKGVSAELLAGSQPVAIPTVKVESLNAAVAAAILLYEASRQRT